MPTSSEIRQRACIRGMAGFTLLEIMIATAIVGALLVTLIFTLNYHLSIAERHEFLTVAPVLAREKMGELENNPGDFQGDFPDPYANYQFLTEVRQSAYPSMAEAWVTVTAGREEFRLVELIPKSP